MFQHDLQHTGRSSVIGPSNAAVKWTFPTALQPHSPAIASDGTVYISSGLPGDNQGSLYAINPDGTQKWQFALAGPSGSTAPTVASDGTIYVHSNGQGNIAGIETLHAVNPNGTLKWKFEFNDGAGIFASDVQSSPAVAFDGTIWVGSQDTFLYALNPNGTLKCGVSPTVSGISSSPAIATNGTVYIVDASTTLFAYTSSCSFLWSFELTSNTGTGNNQSPSVGTDGTIWVGSPADDRLYAVNPNGTLKCSFLTGSGIDSTPAIASDGTVYVGSDGLYAVNPDCTQKWKFSSPLFSSASPVVGGDGTIYWRDSFAAYAVNPNGTQKWQLAVRPSGGLDPSPAIGANGVLYWGDGGTFSSDPTRVRAIETLFYARPAGATPISVSLVPAYKQCTAPNRTHGPPLDSPSCAPPVQASDHLTVGTVDANGQPANSVGRVRFSVLTGDPSTGTDEADVQLRTSLSGVRKKGDLSDYAGELQVRATRRITDKLNGPSQTEPGTVTDLLFAFTVPCVSTGSGGNCALTTTAEALVPGSVIEGKRAIWRLTEISVLDGGADGVVSTSPNTTFAKQGVFVP